MLSRTDHRVKVSITERRAAIAWLTGGVLWFVLEAIAAHAFPNYSYSTNYISDLGNPVRELFEGRILDSPLAWVMNVDLALHGIAFFVGAIFAFRAAGIGRARYVFVALVFCNAFGSTIVAIVHSSNDAVASGAIAWHELGALLSILSGNLAIGLGGIFASTFGSSVLYRAGSVVIALAGLTSFAILLRGGPLAHAAPGFWERGGVYPIMAWEIATGAIILTKFRKGLTPSGG